ncbi:MAG: hypothetical protein WC734_01420 [Patescibacteria group bacterium]|jgi:hypothetical protein
MTDEKWQATIGQIKDSFEVFEEQREDLEDEPGFIEWIVFQSPLGRMKLERTTHHWVTGNKVKGSKRIGSDVSIQKEYSEEVAHKLRAYKWDEAANEWAEIEMAKTSFSS